MSGLSEHVVYDIELPVTVLSQESAIVQVKTLQLEGTRVLVYDPKESKVNTIKAVHLQNTSDMVLANGSCSILEDGRFMGQADFTPMLPGDEQLVPYDQDTSVSILRSYPEELQSITLNRIEALMDESKRNIVGAKLLYTEAKATRYTIKNNSAERTVGSLYIDHAAETARNGFVITTKEHAIKEVTGFARYQISLGPLEEKVIDVAEEANFAEEMKEATEIDGFLFNCNEEGADDKLSEDLRAALRSLVASKELRAIYAKLECLISGASISEKELMEWKERALLPESVVACDHS